MATTTVVPAATVLNCTEDTCVTYCSPWCPNTLFLPPPPPPSSPSSSLSPIIISIICILAAAFLLSAAYFLLNHYCRGRDPLTSLFHRRLPPPTSAPSALPLALVEWRLSPSGGLDRALINKITAFKYRRGDGSVAAAECSVCLSEFREEESLRRLPKCGHAFHMRCIDTWLRSHSNCPLCRAIVEPGAPAPLPTPVGPEQGSSYPGGERGCEGEVVVAVDELNRVVEERSRAAGTNSDGIVEINEEGVRSNSGVSFAVESQHGPASIADVLRESADEEELQAEKDSSCAVGRSSALCCGRSTSSGKR